MKRRDFLKLAGAGVAASMYPFSFSGSSPPETPFRTLFNNDCGSMGLPSAYHKPGDPVDDELIKAAVDETVAAGLEV